MTRNSSLATASHVGTPAHVDVVRSILSEAGLDESALQTPAYWPVDVASHDALAAAGDHSRPLYMTCSGKHAAFLAACVAQGWDTASYLDPSHPLQQAIVDVVEEYTGESVWRLRGRRLRSARARGDARGNGEGDLARRARTRRQRRAR